MISVLAALSMLQASPDVELSRKFTSGQTLSYEVKTHLLAEVRQGGMSYFLPQEIDLNYGYSMKVEEAKPDGFATVLYERPTMTIIEGETADSPPKTKTEKIGMKYRLTLSPINEITGAKDLNEKKEAEKKGKGGLNLLLPRSLAVRRNQDGIGGMIQGLQNLAMFIGNLDSSLDFSPKLPFEDVKVGATWKKTVSYQPRELKGTDKQAVQRLDYTYVYDGLIDVNGKKIHRITGTLDLDTDAAKFVNQMMGVTPEDSGIKEIKLQMKATIKFDLDETTKATLAINAESKGAFNIVLTRDPENPIYEEKMAGKTSVRLTSVK